MKPLAKASDGMRHARLSLSGTSWNKLVVSSNRVSKHYCHDHLDRSDGERWNAEVSALLALQDVVSTHIANDADLTVVAKQGTFVEAETHENLRIKDTLIIKRIAAPELEVDNTFSISNSF